ncbi:MAG: multifunctional CCA addition/repair protein, partial [Magnetococcales bacterium]|nr:multifunctional CCA addition/repair protein [Magnetococcales bacterium]
MEPLRQIYRVGGSVRDLLLGLPAPDRDWVVVGETPQSMLARGFSQVGADFPVFLHPESKEAYALARQERKTGPGYLGFTAQFAPTVTLEADLARRDLTINAMAMDQEGQIIDPFGGRVDLQNRLLRHVSPAFSEDPLRVLRVARFLARFWDLGFRVADETLTLLTRLAHSGELQTLSVERVWQETYKALTAHNPLAFFDLLQQCGALSVLFPELAALIGVPQPVQYHPEGDVWQHTRLVLARATELSDSPTVRFAALLHDLGKAATPPHEWPHHYGHEERSAELIHRLCDRLRIPNAFRNLALATACHHMRCHRLLEMTPNKVVRLLLQLKAFQKPDFFEEVLLACQADGTGRLGESLPASYPQADLLRQCRDCCVEIDPTPWIEAGIRGARLGERLHQERVHRVRTLLQAIP